MITALSFVFVMAMMTILIFAVSINGQDDNTTPIQLIELPDDTRIMVNDYVVMFQDLLNFDEAINEVTQVIAEHDDDGATIRFGYKRTFPGVAIQNVSDTLLQRLLSETEWVDSVSPDYVFDLDNYQNMPENWGLDRIDEEKLPMDEKYHYEYTGEGVNVYILDSGLYQDHIEFSTITDMYKQRSISCGFDPFNNNDSISNDSEKCFDRIGHGSFIAGIVGGLRHGVAKKVNLISVKVYEHGHGATLSTILAGLEYVMQQKAEHLDQPMIVNISLSGARNDMLNAAIENLVDSNVVVVVSAGNDGQSSCTKSPASSKYAITVSATDIHDNKPFWANAGSCINMYAPGHEISSVWIRDRRDTASLAGTSMAAAHVTGVAALYLEKYPTWTPRDVWTALEMYAIRGVVGNIPEQAPENLLLHAGGELQDPF